MGRPVRGFSGGSSGSSRRHCASVTSNRLISPTWAGLLQSATLCRHALVGLKNIRTVPLSVGKLAVHEEFPDLVASAILEFLVGDRGQEAEGSEGTVAER